MAKITKPTKQHLFWHFAPADRRLGYGDGRAIVVGETLTVDPPIELCERGLHASYRAIDALRYSAGPIVCRVRLGGDFCAGTDKVVASERTVMAMADATDVLHEFACWCAERALSAANVTDPRSWRAIETKRKWIAGKATEQELEVAWKAASAAASAAAWATEAAASAAASAAAWATEAAASSAAREAGWAAARAAEAAGEAAAWAAREGESAAAMAAASSAAAAAWAAASSAARAAAREAAMAAQNAHLEKQLRRLLAK